MNRIQNEFLGCMIAVRMDNEKDFNDFIDWASQENLFTMGNNPVKRLSYPGGDKEPKKTFVMYRRTEDMLVYWGYVGLCPEGYKLIDFKDLGIGNSVIEDAATVKDEVAIPEFKVGTIVPAKIEGCNISELKKIALPIIEKYRNTVVTKDNYKEIKELCTRLNKSSTTINDFKKEVKKTAGESIMAFEKEAMEIVNAYKNAVSFLKEQVTMFDDQVKEQARQKIFDTMINPVMNVAITQKIFSEEYRDKFIFDNKWLLKKTTKAELQNGINSEFNRLSELYKQELANISFIKGAIQSQCDSAGIENNVDDSKYIELLKAGMEPGEVMKQVTIDIASTVKTVEAAVDKVTETVDGQFVASSANEEIYYDNKTGEVYAKSNENSIFVKIQETAPNVPKEKIFSYTYKFEGNCKAILTFNKFLKVLSKLFVSFKFNKIKLVKKELKDPKTDKEKEYKVMEED